MSNRTAILACSRYFLGYPQSCLKGAREAKVAKGNLAMDSIRVMCVGDISVWDIFRGLVSMEGAFARDIYIDVGLLGIGS